MTKWFRIALATCSDRSNSAIVRKPKYSLRVRWNTEIAPVAMEKMMTTALSAFGEDATYLENRLCLGDESVKLSMLRRSTRLDAKEETPARISGP
jgi:hypothetical protein